MPDDVELVSISIFFIIELQLPTADGFVSGADSHGLVLILHRWRGDGAAFGKHDKNESDEIEKLIYHLISFGSAVKNATMNELFRDLHSNPR